MKKTQTLLGILFCLSFASFAPKSLLHDGRIPASEGPAVTASSTTAVQRESLIVFGPIVIYKHTQAIEQVRVQYRHLQSDLDLIAKQKREIERLIASEATAMSEVRRLRSELTKLEEAHSTVLADLERIKTEFEAERIALQADIDRLTATNELTEAEKQQALAALEAERALAAGLSTDLENLKKELEDTKAELATAKEQLEEAQAEIVAKEEELQRIKCENEDAVATLRRDIRKIENERDDLNVMMQSMQTDYDNQIRMQQMQQMQMMMAMAQFSFQAMQSPQYNPYMRQSSLFDPNMQMMHMQQAQILTQLARQQFTPQITNNYYGETSFAYGSGHDFMSADPYTMNHYSMFADTQNMNSQRLPSSVQSMVNFGGFQF